MSDLPVVLGGKPVSAKLAFVRPTLPAQGDFAHELTAMLSSGMLTKGEHLGRFERAVAEHLGVRHAIAVSSCTTGLMLVYRCLDLSGEAVTPSFTFMATVSAMVWAGVRPAYADVHAETTTVDPESVRRAITPRTKAIVAVHNFGNPADIDELQQIADEHRLKLIFDAAHGFGTKYQGKPVGSQGDAHIFSLSPTKLLVAGEGGIVATNDDRLAERIRLGREYGNDGTYDSAFAGFNARMAEFNALLGLHGLPLLEGIAEARNAIARAYREGLSTVPGLSFMEVKPGNRCSFKDFSILVDECEFGLSRDQLSRCLTAEGIETRKYYAPTVHRQRAYRHLGGDDALLPNTLRLEAESLSLPIGLHVTGEHIASICRAIARVQQHADRIHASAHAAPPVDIAVNLGASEVGAR